MLRNLLIKILNQPNHNHSNKLFNTNIVRNNIPKMTEHPEGGTTLKNILRCLEEIAPTRLAESWDNVGLLVDPMTDTPINNILLTNDLTEDIVKEAISLKTGLIVSYHPNIFQGLKRVGQRTWKERVVVDCIKNNIAVFSPHTSWDAIQGGVNDWLAKALPIEDSKVIKENVDNPLEGCGRLCTLKKPVTIGECIHLIKKHIGISHLRLALARNTDESATVSTVALCAGSGQSVLGGVRADLYLTGEMLHHDILDATQKNIHVILCNHSDSERGFLKQFRGILENELAKEKVRVFVSKIDKDPLKTV